MITLAAFLCLSPIATDGDTIRCQGEGAAIRMVGIDAPELRGCRGKAGRVCVTGDGMAARVYLQGALNLGPVTIEPISVDRYGRTVARVMTSDGANASCTMILGGHAVAKVRWDTKRGARRDCPSLFVKPKPKPQGT